MSWFEAILLGIVEGLTEYLPVSSTGHLILAQRAMGIEEGEAADAFAICIQAGAILAVLGLYRRRVGQIVRGLRGSDPDGFRLAVNIGMAFIPFALAGMMLKGPVRRSLFGLWPVVIAWAVGGAAILGVGYWRRRRGRFSREGLGLGAMSAPMAMMIGLGQCLALWPGTSRSLVTIVFGLIAGLGVGAAVEFSFLLGALTLLAATAVEAKEHHGALLREYSWQSMVLGLGFAWLFAALSVSWMVGYLKRHSLAVFGWYRVVLAGVAAGLIALGWLRN